jgi:YbbR domain-containing protein
MHRFFRQNLSYRIISLLIAVTLWLWVTTESNPTQEKVLEVPLETKNLAAHLMVAQITDSIKVRIEGRENIVEDITSRDISAIVNLAGAKVGSNTTTVEVTLPAGVQLVNTTPSQVKVVIDQVEEIQVGISVETEGRIQEGYSAITPLATPSEILIKGPKSLLDTIDEVFVTARIEGYSQSYKENLPIKIKDTKGNFIQEWLRLEPSHVEVYIPILKDEPSEKIIVKPAIIGNPADGYQIKQVKVEPEFVEVVGSYNILSTLDYLSTEILRIKDYYNIDDIEFAILETSGEISVIPKAPKRPLTPEDLNLPTPNEGLPYAMIMDGKIDYEGLVKSNHSLAWLQKELKKRGVKDPREVFFAFVDTTGKLYLQLRNADKEKGGTSK